MELTKYLSAMSDLINNKGGLACDIGCRVEDWEEIYAKWVSKGLGKRIRVVKDWCWWDLVGSEQLKIASDIATPSVIYSRYTMSTRDGQFTEGHWVRSTFLVQLHDNCIFETKNTFYMLVGPGSRKSVDIEMALSIF